MVMTTQLKWPNWLLFMSKLLFVIAFITSSLLLSQSFARLNSHNTGWAPVDTYGGTRIKNLIVLFIEAQGSESLQMDTWSVTYRVNGPIYNGIKNFPPEKIKFQFNNLTSIGPGNGTPPSASSLNLNTGILPFQISESYFVNRSPYNLGFFKYSSMNLNYDVIIDGGAYLEEYKSWNNFYVNLIMELRNRNGVVMTQVPVSFEMRIMPTDTPPQTPTYGIQFDARAKNVLLEFKTASDYANGVSKTLMKAFSTFSSTPYVVRINTLSSNLTSSSNKTLPVSAVQLSVKDNLGGGLTNVNLSSSPQTVLSNAAHSATKFFDTTFSTRAGDTTFLNNSSEQYSGTLVFTMIPQ